MSVLFLYLRAFSSTGGIEKFNRSFLKALHELSVDGIIDADAISAYDNTTDEMYFPQLRFYGFGGGVARLFFVVTALFKSRAYKTIVLGHVNLAIVGNMLKWINPSVRMILIVHGIEVWMEHSGAKKKLLEQVDVILSVSNFTKEKIVEHNPTVSKKKIKIFPNTIDPYFELPTSFEKPTYLLERYKLAPDTPILMTLTRLAFSEKYKGYDRIIESMSDLLQDNSSLQYLLCGKADRNEKARVEGLIEGTNTSRAIKLLGFIKDNELNDHYLLADIFVMQSKKEGFGIVFIEALACGRKVIAGSKDGSVEALLNGELGTLIDPDNRSELIYTIDKVLHNEEHNPMHVQAEVTKVFGFHQFKNRLRSILSNQTSDK